MHWSTGAPFLVAAILALVLVSVGVPDWIWWILPATALACVIAMLSAGVRRFHDRGRSGWWLPATFLLPIVFAGAALIGSAGLPSPYDAFVLGGVVIGSMVFAMWGAIELAYLPGDPGPNRFGPPPE